LQARLCTDEYVKPTAENLENNFMHLTNYAINKNASKYVPSSGSADAGVGSKRSLKVIFWRCVRREGGNREKERGSCFFFNSCAIS